MLLGDVPGEAVHLATAATWAPVRASLAAQPDCSAAVGRSPALRLRPAPRGREGELWLRAAVHVAELGAGRLLCVAPADALSQTGLPPYASWSSRCSTSCGRASLRAARFAQPASQEQASLSGSTLAGDARWQGMVGGRPGAANRVRAAGAAGAPGPAEAVAAPKALSRRAWNGERAVGERGKMMWWPRRVSPSDVGAGQRSGGGGTPCACVAVASGRLKLAACGGACAGPAKYPVLLVLEDGALGELRSAPALRKGKWCSWLPLGVGCQLAGVGVLEHGQEPGRRDQASGYTATECSSTGCERSAGARERALPSSSQPATVASSSAPVGLFPALVHALEFPIIVLSAARSDVTAAVTPGPGCLDVRTSSTRVPVS